jgi:tight adherence protein C
MNTISKRQLSIQLAFPDALDLLLICVESGMSIEAALRRVAQEIAVQSIPLSEEMSLTMAELSYLPDRKQAYENFALRTGTDSAKQIALVLAQAEQFGTPLGSALRIVSMEGREKRLMEAEKKAASIPPKLTIPLIVFLLPVLFVALLAPPFLRY